jgi:hypothetical protein
MASQVRQISRQRDEAPRCFERPARKKLVMSTSLSDANATLQLESASDFQLDDPWPMPRPTAIHPQRRGRPKLRREEPPGAGGREDSPYVETAAKLLTMHIIRALLTHRSSLTALCHGGLPPVLLDRACGYMTSRLGENPSLQDIAATAGLSAGHFHSHSSSLWDCLRIDGCAVKRSKEQKSSCVIPGLLCRRSPQSSATRIKVRLGWHLEARPVSYPPSGDGTTSCDKCAHIRKGRKRRPPGQDAF